MTVWLKDAERTKFAGRLLDATTPFTIAPEFRFKLPHFIIFLETLTWLLSKLFPLLNPMQWLKT
jgi:hypothetical protein